MQYDLCIGGLDFRVQGLSEQFYTDCALPYICEAQDGASSLIYTQEKLEADRLCSPGLDDFSLEAGALLEQAVRHCLRYDRMIIHGACIAFQGKGILFLAPSGTGKSTHVSLWKKYLADEVTIVNGDKPMIEFGQATTIHGTPWRGKEGWGSNISVPLHHIVMLKRGSENEIRTLSQADARLALFYNTFLAYDPDCTKQILFNTCKLAANIPVSVLYCDISEAAFHCCFDHIFHGGVAVK